MKGSGRGRGATRVDGKDGRPLTRARVLRGAGPGAGRDGEEGIAEGEKLRSRRWKDADEEGAEFERKEQTCREMVGRYEREFSVLQLHRARSPSPPKRKREHRGHGTPWRKSEATSGWKPNGSHVDEVVLATPACRRPLIGERGSKRMCRVIRHPSEVSSLSPSSSAAERRAEAGVTQRGEIMKTRGTRENQTKGTGWGGRWEEQRVVTFAGEIRADDLSWISLRLPRRVAALFPRHFRTDTHVHRSLSIPVSIHTRNAPRAAINQNLGDSRGTIDRGFTRFTCRRRLKETRRPRVTKRSASRDFYGPVSARKYRGKCAAKYHEPPYNRGIEKGWVGSERRCVKR